MSEPEAALHGRALLIEDNAIVALDTQDMLRTMGYDPVDIASSAADAMKLARAHSYAIAVVDLAVKDGSSAPVAEYLAGHGVALVIASGYADGALPGSVATAPRIQKPYDDVMLRAAIKHARAQVSRNL